MRVLIVKTSSMGDVIHTLPALTDAKRARPDIVFDWVVEEGFSEVPSWHPAVSRVIPVAIRRWRKEIFKAWHSNEWKQFKTTLRKHHYDLVIDAQGLLKSAWVTSFVKAPAAGYDKDSARESLASLMYQHKYAVPKQMHAVERVRSLFAQALGYELPETDGVDTKGSVIKGAVIKGAVIKGDYGIDRHRFYGSMQESRNVVFLHSTTRDDKHYPEVYWKALAEKLTKDGYRVRLPWGAEHERERAKRIAQGINGVEVLPRLNLHGVAAVLAQASAVVAVDTGLGHLSAALNIPTISLYGPTSPSLVGAYGENQIHMCASECGVFNKIESLDGSEAEEVVEPAVFAPLHPEQIYRELSEKMINTASTLAS